MAQYNIRDLELKVFGLTGRYFIADALKAKQTDISYPGDIQVMEEDEVKSYSLLGTPVYDLVEVSYNRKQDPNTFIRETYTFEDPCLLEVNQSKIIVKTPIAGRDGTVKERISLGDHEITIRGLLVNHGSNKYPIEKVNALYNVFKFNDSIDVVSRFLNTLKVASLVIEDIQLPELEGYSNVQPYVIKACSDQAIELKIQPGS